MLEFVAGAFSRENLRWSIPTVIGLFVALVYLIGLAIFWFSSPMIIQGKVVDRSTEISYHTDKDRSSTTIERFVQLEDGSTYAVLWTNHYDQIAIGKTYDFTVKGFRYALLGWRIFTPTIINFSAIKEKPAGIAKTENKAFEVVLEPIAKASADGYDVVFRIESAGHYPPDTIFFARLNYIFAGDKEKRVWFQEATGSLGSPGTFGVSFGQGQNNPIAWVEIFEARANDAQMTKLPLKDDDGKDVKTLNSKPQTLILQ